MIEKVIRKQNKKLIKQTDKKKNEKNQITGKKKRPTRKQEEQEINSSTSQSLLDVIDFNKAGISGVCR